MSPWSLQEAENAKENSKIQPKMTEMPLVGKEHKDPKRHPYGSKASKASPMDQKRQKHPSVDQKSS